MNLGVETTTPMPGCVATVTVSAFSDESWGGDPLIDDNDQVG